MVKIEYYVEAHFFCLSEIFTSKDCSKKDVIQKIVTVFI